ncbi:MAG: sulfatase [Flagellimonas sp.]
MYINRRRYLFAIVIPVIMFGCGNRNSTSQIGSKKNVVFIIVDDLNKALSTYGHPTVLTPNIDRLSKIGVQFNNAHCNYAECNPSRSSLLTGLRPETTGIMDNTTPFQSKMGDKLTLPALFKQNGYYTMGLGKIFHRQQKEHNDIDAWDEIHSYQPTALGKKGAKRNLSDDVMAWCYWQAAEGGDKDQPDGQVAEKAIEFIKSQNEKPYFLAVGMAKPHDPYIAPKKYYDLYPMETIRLPQVPENWSAPNERSFPMKNPVFPKGKEVFDEFSEQDKKEFLRSYYACISFMDAQVGKILDALKESDKLDETIIVLFGDHGYHLGEQNWWNKFTLFEKSTSAPFIIADASNAQNGKQSEAMFEFIDIYPTMAELLGLKGIPEYLEGESFVDQIRDPGLSFRPHVRATMTRVDGTLGKSVKNEKWRYIEWDKGKHGIELYDQKNDPNEYKNLAELDEYDQVVLEMRKLLWNQ